MIKAKPDDQEQAKRFEQTARELGVDLDEAKLAENLRRIAKREFEKRKKPEKVDKPRSDDKG
jgi:hypothetical protein